MRLTILVDNNSLIDQYYLAEPALSFYLEDEDNKILFDLGYSDIFIQNAAKMNINLQKINTIVFSHGHNDHSGGLAYLNLKQPIKIYCHPCMDNHKEYQGLNISCPKKLNSLANNYEIIKTIKAVKISPHLTFLGEIERTIQPVKGLENDLLLDDSALVYQNEKGIFIITGCSHSGICNIIEQAKKITHTNHILGIIGGFHLLNDPINTAFVAQYLSKEDIDVIYPCHCTDLQAKIALSKVCKIKEVGVSSIIEI